MMKRLYNRTNNVMDMAIVQVDQFGQEKMGWDTSLVQSAMDSATKGTLSFLGDLNGILN